VEQRPRRKVSVIEALEAYSSEHPETIDELLAWPWKRLEAFLEAHQKRKVAEDLNQRKQAQIMALFSNPNWDGENAEKRQEFIDNMERQFEESLMTIYGGQIQVDEEDVDLYNDPFFKKGYEKFEPLSGDEEQSRERNVADVPRVDQN
jgi:hypothetical protein